MPSISIIICTYHRNNLLYYALDSIFKKNLLNYSYEIIICDETKNGDNDLIELLKKFDQLNIFYLHTGKNKNEDIIRCPAYAFNIAVKNSDSKIILLAGPEIFCYNDAIDQTVKAFQNNKNIMTIPLIVKDDFGYYLNSLEKNEKINFDKYQNILNPELPFFMGIEKENYIKINGYDEEFLSGLAWEDSDFIFRLNKICKYYTTNAQIIHLYHGDHIFFSKLSEEDKLRWKYNQQLYLKKVSQNEVI